MPLSPTSWPSAGAAASAWTATVTKAVDESVSASVAPQNDDELFFATVAAGLYLVEAFIIYASPVGAGVPDLRLAFGEDATVRGAVHLIGLDAVDSDQLTSSHTGQEISTWGTAAGNRAVFIQGEHAGNGGTFFVQWAQATSNANATTVRAGSYIRYLRVL